MNPLEPDRLSQLLGALQSAQTDASFIAMNNASNQRCQTSSPPPTEDAVHRQSRDRTKLVQAGGRPVMPITQLGPLSAMTEQNIARAAPWLDLPRKNHDAYREMPPLFSKQLEHWTAFQQYWQWGNRGAAGRDKGFDVFLESMKKDYEEKGETEALADEASLESMARRMWQYEQPRQTVSSTNTESFASYVCATRERLVSHGFTRPLRLSEDPLEQDEWTMWVEYLSYIYWETDRDAATMESSKPGYRLAMEELLDGEEGRPFEIDQDIPLHQQVEAANGALREQRARIRRIRQNAKDYLTHEALVRRGQLKAAWALGELALIKKGSVKNEEKGRLSMADAEDKVKGVDMQASAAAATSNSINRVPGSSRQLRKRRRDDEYEEKRTSTDVNAQDGEAAPSPHKRSRTRGSRSFASSAPATSATEAPPERILRRSQRIRNSGGDAVTRVSQVTDADADAAASDTGVRPRRRRKPTTVR